MFKDLKVIVTGAASGFGYAIAERLLKYGAAEGWLFDFNAFKLEEARDVLSEEFPNRVFSKHVDISVENVIGLPALLKSI